MNNLRAGISRVNITPPVGMYLIGMERLEPSHGFLDDLYATALAISNGHAEVVIVSLDILIVHPKMVERVRKEASASTGIAPDHIMFCATHCHSGPVSYAEANSRPMYRAYYENLIFTLIGLIRTAYDNMAPACIGFGKGASRIGMNRRLTRSDGVTVIDANPEGPIDEEVGVMRVDRPDGNPLAVVVNYACHPVVLGNGSNVISADWPGAMRRTVENITDAKVLFIQGASADINPWPGVPCDRVDVLERLGLEIGAEVLKVWSGIETTQDGTIGAAQRKVWLPLLPVSQYAGKLPDFVELADSAAGMTFEQLQAWLDDHMPWVAELSGEGDDIKAALEMQCFRISDIVLVSAGAEIFVNTGLEVKQHSPFNNTMFAAYTNGALCYIPLPEDYPRGGYEVSEAYLGYRLPAPVAPESAGLVVQSALDLIDHVS